MFTSSYSNRGGKPSTVQHQPLRYTGKEMAESFHQVTHTLVLLINQRENRIHPFEQGERGHSVGVSLESASVCSISSSMIPGIAVTGMVLSVATMNASFLASVASL